MYVSMYVCMDGRLYKYVCMYGCALVYMIYVCIVCQYVCMYVCTDACMYVGIVCVCLSA